MTRLFTCGLIAAVLLTGATLADPMEDNSAFGILPASGDRIRLQSPTALAECVMLKHIVDDTALGYNMEYLQGQRTVTYFDPAECSADPYPFEITGLSFSLLDPWDSYDPRQWKWPVEIDVVSVFRPVAEGPRRHRHRIFHGH